MRIRVFAIGTRMPNWVKEGFQEYARRLPRECVLELVEVSVARRGRKSPALTVRRSEGERLLALAQGAYIVALDQGGQQTDTPGLAGWLQDWMGSGRDVALLIGGADGLAPECIRASHSQWSLSRLTLPHMLVRVVVAEQLYRAWTVLSGHPYHRA